MTEKTCYPHGQLHTLSLTETYMQRQIEITQVDNWYVTSRVDRIIKKYFEIFSNFFTSAVIFLVQFDPKVNKKVNYEKKAKNDDQKIFF